MHSCIVVVINEALEKSDVTYAATPSVQLKAVPYGSFKKQLVRQVDAVDQEVFAVYEALTNLPANINGMAMFLIIYSSDGTAFEIKGKINSDIKGLVSFRMRQLSKGFYSYKLSVRAKDYDETILDGTYVIQS